ncbi:MAG TPA: lysylphosphatidylglycerol synthase transmembrane domain-containing protein [Candidatus Eisenbacteria bacterium]|nr:lysylphosphatidylglycerol synthase transmembrane domain-containing protein [Candidatus Eisenbacteria bacterium]
MSGRPSARSLLLLGAKVAFSVLLFAFLLRRLPVGHLGATLRGADRGGLVAAFLLLLASNVLGAFQWDRLLRAVDIRLPFWKVCAYYHVGLFFNNFLPANVGGDFARILDASRGGSSRATALSTVLLDRMIGTVALGGLAVVTTLPAIRHFHLAAAYAGVVAFLAAGAVMLWAVFHPALLATVERVLRRVGLGRLTPALDELAARIAHFRGQRGLMLRLLAVATAVQVMRIGVHVLVARALGLHVGLAYFFLFVPLLAVIVSLPISLNGIGVREGAGILLFGLVGLDRGSAFSLQFTTYLVAVAVSLIGGLVFLARIPHRRATARTPGRPPA